LKDLKTSGSHKLMPLPQVAVDALQLWQKAQRKVRMAATVWLDADLVFTTATGTAIDPRNANRWSDRLCDRAGVRHVRLHDLRHACATYLMAEGVDIKAVSGQLPHTRLATTEIYTHLLAEVQRDTADKMDAIITDLGAAKEPGDRLPQRPGAI
jgi:site-specific recombinase XerD